MIDITREQLCPLRAAWRLFPNRPHAGTPIRWARRGVRGVKLESTPIGGRWYTSRQAVERFLKRLRDPSHTARASGEPHTEVEAALDREGI